jgi:hypothetical protein
MFAGTSMPARMIFALGCFFWMVPMMARRFFWVTAGAIPRRPSFPPRAMMMRSTFRGRLTSSFTLRTPPFVVSPDQIF